MNKKLLLAATLTASVALTAGAQSDYRFGFCDNTATLNDKMISTDGAMTVDAAIYFTPEDMARFAQGSITGVNVGIHSKYNTASIKAWLRDDISGQDIASNEVSSETDPALGTGWNSIRFDSPVAIEQGKGYYVGYTMTFSKAANFFLLSSQEGTHAGACWVRIGEGEWQDLSETYGILNLEALIQSDNLPQNDLELTAASIEDTYIVSGTPFTVKYSVHNAGMLPVDSYTLVISDEENGLSQSHTVTCDLQHDARQEFTELFSFDGLEPEKDYNFTLKIEKPNGKDDESPSNNEMAMEKIASINGTFARSVLIEEFTTESCPNCPPAANNLHTMYNSLTQAEKDRVAIVCHHSGYGVDRFTKPCDSSLVWFYNSDRVFAPAFMFNRTTTSGNSPVHQPLSATGLKQNVSEQLKREAFYSIDIRGSHDEENKTINLHISGKAAAHVFDNPLITIYVVEDNVKPYSQAGASAGFMHNHLIRAYSSTWGKRPTWDKPYEYSSTAELSYADNKGATCKIEDMEIVALIANYDNKNPNNCEVGNVAKVKLTDLKQSGISETFGDAGNAVKVYSEAGQIRIAGEYESFEVYDLSGSRTAAEGLTSGIYLVRVNTAAGPVLAKVMVK